MKRERSVLPSMPPMAFSTSSSVIVIFSPARSVAVNERSSMRRSTRVCSRRAPMFSTSRLICVASFAIIFLAPSVMSSCTPSASMRASCCLTRLWSGSVRMRYRSFSESGLSSTRMGSRPCSSARRSLGLQKWKAPEAMKRIWSVLTLPTCLVETTEPSSSGSRSRCTPSDEASAEPRKSPREQILSISSMKTIVGAFSSATRKSSRTSLGPSPRYFWMSSEPVTRRKVALVWLATALASSVLPVPGSPYRMTPLGGLMPMSS
mmetsp:Transcript_22777/g.54151  ORF Transcript_22777/g.54151 Transcript_22777/m.54151 type:complete len:263 (+) Transcript_22777:270-1058(+)